MFIDVNGNLQFDSIEEFKGNEDIAIREFNNWVVPTVEDIELQIVTAIQDSLEALESVGIQNAFGESIEESLDTMFFIMRTGMEMAVDIFSKDIAIDCITAKVNDYANRFYLACDIVRDSLR